MLKHQQFAEALVHVARCGDLLDVRWLMEVYLPTGRVRHAIESAARHGQLHILKWLRGHHNARVVWRRKELHQAVRGDHFETAKWLYEHFPPQLTDRDVDCMVDCALDNGNLDMVDWICRLSPAVSPSSDQSSSEAVFPALQRCPQNQSFLTMAVSSGRLDLAQWLYAHGSIQSVDAWAIAVAAWSGHLEMIEWVYEHLAIAGGVADIGAVIANAAFEGHLDIVKYLHLQNPRAFSSHWADAMESAAGAGHFEIVKYLYHNCSSRSLGYPIDAAARSGNFEIVKWLYERVSMPFKSRAMDLAAATGSLQIVKWLHEMVLHGPNGRAGCTSAAMDWAARSDYLDIVRFLHENRHEGSTSAAMDGAAANGHLEMVKWLHEHRSEGCTTAAMNAAAANGRLEVVKWLHDHHFQCTTDAMDTAASNGHLEIVQWLQEHRTEGCTSKALAGAASNGHLDVIEWLLSNPIEGITHVAMDAAAANGHLEVVEWLYHNRGEDPRSVALWRPGQNGHTHVVDWLVTHRSFNSVFDLEDAIRGGHLAKLIAHHDSGLFQCSPELFQFAVWDQQLEILQWLLIEYPDQSPYDATSLPHDPYVRDVFDQAKTLRLSV